MVPSDIKPSVATAPQSTHLRHLSQHDGHFKYLVSGEAQECVGRSRSRRTLRVEEGVVSIHIVAEIGPHMLGFTKFDAEHLLTEIYFV